MSEQKKDTLIYEGKTFHLKSATLVDVFSNNVHRSSPIAPLLEANNLTQYFASPYMNFNPSNMRGYLCSWKIEDSKLYLTAFSSSSSMVYSINQLLGLKAPANSPEYKAMKESIQALKEEFEKQYGSISELKKDMQELCQPFDDCPTEIVPKAKKEAYSKMRIKEMSLMKASNHMDKANVLADWFSGSIEVTEFNDYNGQINGLQIEIVNGLIVNTTPCHIASYRSRPLNNYIEN